MTTVNANTKYSHFFIVGGQRCGTTSLVYFLDSHPNISMAKPIAPEPKYFLSGGDLSYEDYISLYFSADLQDNNIRFLGEKSTSYYEYPDVGNHIKKVIPDSKIVFLLRNPIYRALSNYYFTKSYGLETRSLQEVFLDKLPEPPINIKISTNPFSYLSRGQYIDFIDPYEDIFGKSNVRVLIFEHFLNRTESLSDLCTFLGIENIFQDAFSSFYYNNSGFDYSDIDSKVLETLATHYSSYNKRLETKLGVKIPEWTTFS